LKLSTSRIRRQAARSRAAARHRALIVVAGPPNEFGSHAIGLDVVRNYESGDEG